MTNLGRREWMISTLGAFAACQRPRDPYAPPAIENGGLSLGTPSAALVRTICGMCPAACGIEVRMSEGRALSIAGNAKAEFNQGRVCPLGLAGIEGLYHPHRLPGPMRRTGPRGQPNFQPISWDEAMAWLVERLTDLRAQAIPEQLVLFEGQGSFTTSLLWSRFLAAFGSPNHFAMGPVHKTALSRAVGEATGFANLPVEDIHHATYVLAVGESALEAGASWIGLVGALSQDHRPVLGCASPRQPLSGPTPDEFFPIRPGSAGLFQLALAQVLVRTGMADHSIIPEAQLTRFSPDRVADQVGLGAELIERLARRLAGEKRVVILPDETHDDETSARAWVLLRRCLGKRAWAANSLGQTFPRWPEFASDQIAQTGNSMPSLDRHPDRSQPRNGRSDIIQALVSGYPYKTSLLLLSGEGVEVSKKALSTGARVVSFSSFLTETSQFADLLLPNHHFLEAWDIHPMGRDDRLLGQSYPVVRPGHDSRATGDVILELAKRSGGRLAEAFPWVSHEAAVKSIFLPEIISGLEAKGTLTMVPQEACFPPRATLTPLNLGPKAPWKFHDPLPLSADSGFPFVLVPAWGWGDLVPDIPWIDELPFVPGNPYVPRLEIHPTDALRLGIRTGETVRLETPNFSVIASAFFRGGLRPGVLALNRRPAHFTACQARVRRSP